MASEEHKELAQYLKRVHANLRNCAVAVGANDAWKDHCKSKQILMTYAKYMEKLATVHWEENCASKGSYASSRIEWAVNLSQGYFINKGYEQYSQKENEICRNLNIQLHTKELFNNKFELLDVGSCYNPFRSYDIFNVLAIDLCPANKYVKECDFLNVDIGEETIIKNNLVMQIKKDSFDVITFCFLLEYLPSSKLRISACENAYKLLKPGGLLIIITPDSKHVGANCKIMKCWQYTLACIGFIRIKYEKLKHMHCMGYRKSLHKDVAIRWATLHKLPYMEYSIHIPQDFISNESKPQSKRELNQTNIHPCLRDFSELPFSDLSLHHNNNTECHNY